MSKEEEKYLIALGNLQNMAIDNTKGSKAVEICANDIRTYVERLNNIINECANEILKELQENHHLSYGVALAIRQKLINYNELKGDNK